MIEVNLSPDGTRYYRQGNNRLKPSIRCKPTATVEGLDLAGWPLPSGYYDQPEDNLTDFCERTWGPDAPEDWACIMTAVNADFLRADAPVVGPRWDWDLREALFGLLAGRPFVASTSLTKAGHVVVMVGFKSLQPKMPATWQEVDLAAITEIIIDDPYGDAQAPGGYTAGKSGWNCAYTLPAWLKVWRSTGIQIRRSKK